MVQTCTTCHAARVKFKHCLTCGKGACGHYLLTKNNWAAEALCNNAWICLPCDGYRTKEIFDDHPALYHIKTGHFPLGMMKNHKNRVRRLRNKYVWDEGTQLFMRAGNASYGARVVPVPNERDEIINSLHRLGHVGISKVAKAVVSSYFWHKMNEDVQWVINNCTCGANKPKITIVAPLKPTPMPLGPFELVAIDLMTLTRSKEGNRYIITAQDYFIK